MAVNTPTVRNFRRWIEEYIRLNHKCLIEVTHRPNVCVQIVAEWDNGTAVPDMYVGTGFAKVCYPDRWDENEGLAIALAKAVADISKQIVNDLDRDLTFKAKLIDEFSADQT